MSLPTCAITPTFTDPLPIDVELTYICGTGTITFDSTGVTWDSTHITWDMT